MIYYTQYVFAYRDIDFYVALFRWTAFFALCGLVVQGI